MLQPVWDGMLRGEPYVSNAFFAGTIGTASFVLVCTYFTCLDLTHSLSTKVQKDYFPSAKDQWAAAWPQLLIYALGQTATWYSWSMYPASLSIDLPRQAPELWKFVVDFSVCQHLGIANTSLISTYSARALRRLVALNG